MRTRRPPAAGEQHSGGRYPMGWVVGFTLLLSIPTLPSADSHSRDSSSVSRFLAQPGPELQQYRALRRMHATCERFDQEASLEAWTELDERGFRYDIVREEGSEYIRNKVLRAILKREQELIAAGHADRASFTSANYEFTEGPSKNDGLTYVVLKPKRKDVLLVDGRMVLNRDGTDLLRVEGRLAKNPSFWTSLVNITRHFAKVDGVRVPVSTESVAKVKFAGKAHFRVRYEYETINGRPVSLSARAALAADVR
jgi:hypothetical protein